VTRTQFMGRCRMEPAPLQQQAAEQFGRGHHQFMALLQQVLPDQLKAERVWKLDMVVTMLIRVLTEVGREGMLLPSAAPADLKAAVDKLVLFATAGIRASHEKS